MARVKFKISDELNKEITAEADLLWPGHGTTAVRRLIRDSIRRLWRYSNGEGRAKHRDGQ